MHKYVTEKDTFMFVLCLLGEHSDVTHKDILIILGKFT